MDIKYPRVNIPLEHAITRSPNRYTVRPGDTLAQIARRFDITADDLIRYNNLKNRHSLTPGMEIEIPPQSKAMTLEKAISISGGSTYAAASRVNQSWNNFIGQNHTKEITKIKDHLGFSGDISISYSKRSYFSLKLLHTISFNNFGIQRPEPFLSALTIFYNESRDLLQKASTAGNTPVSQISRRSLQTLHNAVDYLSKRDFSKTGAKPSKMNKISDYYGKTGFRNLSNEENKRSIVNALIEVLNSEGITNSVISEPNKSDLTQLDVFLAGFGTILGW